MPLNLTGKERELLGLRAAELDTDYDALEARRATEASDAITLRSSLANEQRAHSATKQERDTQINERTRAHRESVTYSQVSRALQSLANGQALNDAVGVMLAESAISRRDDGSIKEITLRDGATYASLEVAAEMWLAEHPWLHRDWSVAEQRIVSDPALDGESANERPSGSTDAIEDFNAGYRSLPVAMKHASGPAEGAHPGDPSISNADEDLAFGFSRGPQDAA